jgi:acyl-CoA reductase-like NAD-dependent aldehyde dehydrogenase
MTGGFGLVVPYKSAKDCILLSKAITAPLTACVYGSREIAANLKFGTVSLDCFGIRDPAVARSRHGKVGNGVVGGKAGLAEFLVPKGEADARPFWKRMDSLGDLIRGYDGSKQQGVGAAIATARKAVGNWATGKSGLERIDIVRKLATGLLEKKHDLAPFFSETVSESIEAAFNAVCANGVLGETFAVVRVFFLDVPFELLTS